MPIKSTYTEYFITTASSKLTKRINIKELIDKELEERFVTS